MLESLLAVSTRFPGLVVGLDSRLGSDKASVSPQALSPAALAGPI